MNNYIVLDLENPNTRGNSICSIAITVVKDGNIIEELYTLIDPEDRFDSINSRITGIDNKQIQGAPTLKEYWGEIKEKLENNLIVGHNIAYDLSVLSKALYRYDIPVPAFKYCCTLSLSKKHIVADSYHLESLCERLGFVYDAHVASEDVKAAHFLFEYLQSNYQILDSDYRTYHKSNALVEHIDEKLVTNINNLVGIIEGVTSDGIINDKEIARLRKWLDDNQVYKSYAMFNRIINEISVILQDNLIDTYEQIKLKKIVQSIDNSKLYNETTLGLQLLEGIVEGISCDDVINENEIKNLHKWLLEHNYLSGVYPFDKIYYMIENVLEDRRLSEIEKNDLAIAFRELYSPTTKPLQDVEGIDVVGKTFCLSGEFSSSSKSDISMKLIEKGAVEKTSVSSKVDYLFIGGCGSVAWKYGKIGGKIAKALELQEKGSKIQIIDEEELMKYL